MSASAIRFADLPEVRIAYRLDGEPGAPLLVLANSLGTTLDMWDAQIPAFAAGFRVLRHDPRGQGLSGTVADGYGVDALGRDVLALMDYLAIDRADFCGLSMGGATGIWLAVHAAPRFRKFALCNTAAKIGTEETWNARIAAVRAGGVAAVAEAILERWFSPAFHASDAATVARVRAMLRASDTSGYCANSMAIRDMDLRARLSEIGQPVLVTGGVADGSTPPAETRKLAAAIAGARYVELNAAHLSNIEAAADFNTAVLAFFRNG